MPPEVESANAVDAKAKPGAKPKPGPKLNKGTESGLMLQEEAFTVVEQMTYSGSAVRRVPDTMEMSDFFQVPIQSGVETEAELRYSIESVPTSLQKEAAPSAEGPTDLAAFIDKLLATNPNFAQITRLQDLDESRLIEKRLQRPVGYAATARVHMGRLCVPMLNDSGATCSLLTEGSFYLQILP